MSRPSDYGAAHIKALRKALKDGGVNVPGPVQIAATGTIRFLERRLTDAAKAGCHHCTEGPRGAPCWWCGLKNGGQ